MAVFAVAAGILLFTTPVDASIEQPDNSPSLTNPDDDIDREHSLASATPTPSPSPDPTPEVPTEVRAIGITFDGRVLPDFALYPGENLGLGLMVEPLTVVEDNNMRITWASSDEDVFMVVPMLHNGNNWRATVTGIASTGNARLIVTVGDPEEGGMEFSIPVYTRKKP